MEIKDMQILLVEHTFIQHSYEELCCRTVRYYETVNSANGVEGEGGMTSPLFYSTTPESRSCLSNHVPVTVSLILRMHRINIHLPQLSYYTHCPGK